MATIVMHKKSGKNYVLIGTGYGAYKSQLPGLVGGALFPREDAGEIPAAAVSDREGNILWLLTEELVVTEVDGKPIGSYFGPASADDRISEPDASEAAELCPGCGHRVAADTKECPSCGLALIVEEVRDDS
jgi:hypothetical protein